MKKRITILLVVLIVAYTIPIWAGDKAELDSFHSIIVTSEIVAELILSNKEAIEIDFKNAKEEDLIIEVVDSVLSIRMRTGRDKESELNVKIYYNKDLRVLEADGRAQIWSEEDIYFDRDLSVKMSNGGEMRFKLFCDSLNATLSQGSIIYLTGKARKLNVKVTTNATFSGYEFETRETVVKASSTGVAKISVSQSLKAKASTKGFIGYVGEPSSVDEKTSLKGEILKTFLE